MLNKVNLPPENSFLRRRPFKYGECRVTLSYNAMVLQWGSSQRWAVTLNCKDSFRSLSLNTILNIEIFFLQVSIPVKIVGLQIIRSWWQSQKSDSSLKFCISFSKVRPKLKDLIFVLPCYCNLESTRSP